MHSPSSQNVPRDATILVTSTLTVLAVTGISAALPTLYHEFEEAPDAALLVRLVLTIPALFIMIGAPLAGTLIDRYGRIWLLTASIILFAIAGAAPMLARSLSEMLVARAVLGLAVAGLMTTLTTLIADFYDGPARSRLLGYQQAAMGLGGAIFVAAGGALTAFGSRAPFLLHLIALAILPFVLRYVPEPPIASWTARTSTGPDTGLDRAGVILVAGICALGFLLQVSYNSLPIQLPFYLPEVTGATAAEAGLAISGLVLSYSAAALAAGSLGGRFRMASLLAGGYVLGGGAFLLVWRADGWSAFIPGLILIGAGFGLVLPTLSAAVTTAAPPALRGRIVGAYSTSMFFGQFVSPLLLQPVIDRVGTSAAFGLIGAILLLTGVTIWLGGRRALRRSVATVLRPP
ncbi:MAG: MFS transporter [Dehalococcoidia bacterium]